jgi:hypothetical protein
MMRGSARRRKGAPRRPRSGAVRGGAGDDKKHGGGVGTDAVDPKQARGVAGHEWHDELVEAEELVVEELGSPAELAKRDRGGVADMFTGTGT